MNNTLPLSEGVLCQPAIPIGQTGFPVRRLAVCKTPTQNHFFGTANRLIESEIQFKAASYSLRRLPGQAAQLPTTRRAYCISSLDVTFGCAALQRYHFT